MIRQILNWFGKRKADNTKLNWKLNLRKSPQDIRDFPLTTTLLIYPDNATLEMWCTPVKNQLNLGSCSAFAFASAFELLIKKNRNEILDLSELGFYYDERSLRNAINIDAGAYLRDGCNVLLNTGFGLETFCPYDLSKWKEEPSFAYYFSAKLNWKWMKISRYEVCNDVTDIRLAIASGYPVVIGIKCDNTIYNTRGSQGKQWINLPKDPPWGHAVCAVAYDNEGIKIKNSWGENWGDNGYAWISDDYLNKYLIEGWIIKE